MAATPSLSPPGQDSSAAAVAIPAVTPAVLRYGKSFGIGSAFAVGWTPCIGPILGAILTLAAQSGTVLQGTFLLAAWSLGLGVPFLIAGFALGAVMRGIRKIRPIMPVLEAVGGVLVIFIGALIFLDEFTLFNQYFTGGVTNVTSAEEGLAAVEVESLFGFAVAFAAGIVAFLSPCTLPMVPAYLMHLAGVAGEEETAGKRGVTFRHALAFVGGFTALFVGLGASAGAFGFFVQDHLRLIEQIAGVLLIIMGLNLLGIIRIPWLFRTYQLDLAGPNPAAGGPR